MGDEGGHHQDAVFDAVDFWTDLWVEADQFADEHLPPAIRERADENADPLSELHCLLPHFASLSSACRGQVIDVLRTVRYRLIEARNGARNSP